MKFLHVRLPRSSSGFILMEACASLALIALVLSAVSLLLIQHSHSTDHFLNYRRAQLAAESCVDRMRLGDIEVVDADFTDESGISYEIRVRKADDQWQPLRLVSVLAVVGGSDRLAARYSATAYLKPTAPRRRHS